LEPSTKDPVEKLLEEFLHQQKEFLQGDPPLLHYIVRYKDGISTSFPTRFSDFIERSELTRMHSSETGRSFNYRSERNFPLDKLIGDLMKVPGAREKHGDLLWTLMIYSDNGILPKRQMGGQEDVYHSGAPSHSASSPLEVPSQFSLSSFDRNSYLSGTPSHPASSSSVGSSSRPSTPYPSFTKGPITTSRRKCFVATAAYGYELSPEVIILRQFRDKFLIKHRMGSVLVNLYDRYGPLLATKVERHSTLKKMVRVSLRPIVYFCKVVCLRN
jgi:hypothetical protein